MNDIAYLFLHTITNNNIIQIINEPTSPPTANQTQIPHKLTTYLQKKITEFIENVSL